MTKTTMRLSVDGIEKQSLVAILKSEPRHLMMDIEGLPEVSGENHVNPQAITNMIMAYKTFESIRRDYQSRGAKQVKIEVTYE